MNNEQYIQRCIELARQAEGQTSPNPMVGAVVVCNNRIIGEGFHHRAGLPHAEVEAINAVADRELLKNSALYVNLEPCSHFGKTPPCADLIITSKIPKVVVGTVDPSPKVAGRGLIKLARAGIDVDCGILEDECYDLNRRFFRSNELQRPYIILKWAETADGFIDALRNNNQYGASTPISCQEASELVHKWRSIEDAIMIGSGTAIKDNPQLTTRKWIGKNPIRIVIDRQLKLPRSLNLFDGSAPTIVLTTKSATNFANIEFITLDGDNFLPDMLKALYERDIQSILLEGGSQLLNLFIKNNLYDEIRIIKSPVIFGSGVDAPIVDVVGFNKFKIGRDDFYWMKR